jgi:hypothetical protein
VAGLSLVGLPSSIGGVGGGVEMVVVIICHPFCPHIPVLHSVVPCHWLLAPVIHPVSSGLQ